MANMMERIKAGEEFKSDELIAEIARLEKVIEELKAGRKRGSNRQLELLELLAKGPAKILDLAGKMGVSSKNVSSLKVYLKKQGWGLINDEEGRVKITKYKGKDIKAEKIREFVEKERAALVKSQEADTAES